jgi:large subunit ribosomal protein L17
MRHGKKDNHLGRTSQHKDALMSNMASSLIIHKRITTTLAKAKELRKYVEPLITRAKADSTHSRRTAFSFLQNKDTIKELFGQVAEKTATRPGGYTRIIKLGSRAGDNADMCIMELVDFNTTMLEAASTEKAKTRRSRRGTKAKTTEVAAVEGKKTTAKKEASKPAEDTPSTEATEEPKSE